MCRNGTNNAIAFLQNDLPESHHPDSANHSSNASHADVSGGCVCACSAPTSEDSMFRVPFFLGNLQGATVQVIHQEKENGCCQLCQPGRTRFPKTIARKSGTRKGSCEPIMKCYLVGPLTFNLLGVNANYFSTASLFFPLGQRRATAIPRSRSCGLSLLGKHGTVSAKSSLYCFSG